MDITKHAYKRAKKRLRWSKETLNKMAATSLEKGLSHSDCKGRLNRYVTRIWNKNKNANNIKIYGENIFIFRDLILITIYRVPNNIAKCIKYHDR